MSTHTTTGAIPPAPIIADLHPGGDEQPAPPPGNIDLASIADAVQAAVGDKAVVILSRRSLVETGELCPIGLDATSLFDFKHPVYLSKSIMQRHVLPLGTDRRCKAMAELLTALRSAITSLPPDYEKEQMPFTFNGDNLAAVIGPTDYDDPSPCITVFRKDETTEEG